MAFLLKGILVYLLLAIAVTMWAPQVIFNSGSPSDATVLSWFKIKLDANNQPYYDTGGAYALNGSAATSVAQMGNVPITPSGNPTLLTGLDSLFQVFSWIATFGKVLFSPIIIFSSPAMTGAPMALLWIFAIPIVLLFLVSIIAWIRSGET